MYQRLRCSRTYGNAELHLHLHRQVNEGEKLNTQIETTKYNRTAKSNKTLTKKCSITIIQFIVIRNYRQKKLKKSTFTTLVLTVDNFEKFTVGVNAFRTLITR